MENPIPPPPPQPPMFVPNQNINIGRAAGQTSGTLGNTGLINQQGLFKQPPSSISSDLPQQQQQQQGFQQGGGYQGQQGYGQEPARHVQNTFMGQGQGQQQGQVQTFMQPVRSETIQREPVIMERISQVEKDIIKPIIHREREQTEIRQVTQPYVEKQFRPETVETRELPAEYRPPIVQSAPENTVRQYQEERNKMRSSVNILPKQLSVMEERPIILEEVKRIIREEVQPVIYREVVAPSLVRETKHIYEKVVEAPRVIQETRGIKPLHELKSWNVMPGQAQMPMQQPIQQQQPQFQQPIQQPIQQQQPQFQQPIQQQRSIPQQQPQPQPPMQQQFQQPGLFLNREITEIERHKAFPYAGAAPVPLQDVRFNSWGMSHPLGSTGSQNWGMPYQQQQPGNWGYGQQQGNQFPGTAPSGWR